MGRIQKFYPRRYLQRPPNRRKKKKVPRKNDDGTHTNVNETIDRFGVRPVQADKSYGLQYGEWAQKTYQVAVAELKSSVKPATTKPTFGLGSIIFVRGPDLSSEVRRGHGSYRQEQRPIFVV